MWKRFNFGYERVEILTDFTNVCLILFECAFGVLHNLHHNIVARFTGVPSSEEQGQHHAHYGSGKLCLIARLRLVADLVGLLLFVGQLQMMLGRTLRRRKASLPPHSENMATVVLIFVGSLLAALVAFYLQGSFKNMWPTASIACFKGIGQSLF